jgi:ATP-binding cassette subfamily F protein uup
VIGYLQDFLFPPERSRSLVRILSGGERNRLLLAKLFTKPSNVLVLDEPTNDLDVETLELLESLCVDYPGTILLVSHDRAFLNDVATSTLVIDPDGRVKEFDGGYDDALRQNAFEPPEPSKSSAVSAPKSEPSRSTSPKLSYKERQELERLPQQIEDWETRQAAIHSTMSDPAFYARDRSEITREAAALEEIESKLRDAYARWEELDRLASQ